MIEVVFKLKTAKKSIKENINFMDIKGEIEIKDNTFKVRLNGEFETCINVLRDIWELSFLYDGYFYKPILFKKDQKEQDVDKLIFLDYYNTSSMWVNSASPLCEQKDNYSEKLLEGYSNYREQGRKHKKTNKILINSFFYLHSTAYENINKTHLLTLFLNIADGISINIWGKTNNVNSNIKSVLKNIDINSAKQGICLLGLSKSKFYDYISSERNEIDHYVIQSDSLGQYVYSNSGDDRVKYIHLYYIYIIELAIRVLFLEQIGCNCSDEKKNHALNEILDWIILSLKLDEKCKNPINRFRQIQLK